MQRAQTYAFVRKRTRSYALVRIGTHWYALVRIRTHSYAFVRVCTHLFWRKPLLPWHLPISRAKLGDFRPSRLRNPQSTVHELHKLHRSQSQILNRRSVFQVQQLEIGIWKSEIARLSSLVKEPFESTFVIRYSTFRPARIALPYLQATYRFCARKRVTSRPGRSGKCRCGREKKFSIF